MVYTAKPPWPEQSFFKYLGRQQLMTLQAQRVFGTRDIADDSNNNVTELGYIPSFLVKVAPSE